ncbi:MAG: PadR family transcriptional regulator [Chloroflexi bacterium HGW-Chloroflexi-10]|nr:MAG: PadR family transcriptional regulator [Chloroflexi bacterium HGW-Chloroflexi-10]
MINENKDLSKYLPLTESTFYILAALDGPLHGYAIMQKVEIMSQGTMKLGAGTLYGAFSTLEQEKIINMVGEESRRKIYELTEKGRNLFQMQVERLKIMLENGEKALQQMNGN